MKRNQIFFMMRWLYFIKQWTIPADIVTYCLVPKGQKPREKIQLACNLHKPDKKGYLFEGIKKGEPYSTRSLQEVIQTAKNKAE